jgi:disulfide bond formation protein DsbB
MIDMLREWRRPINFGLFVICTVLLAWAYYLQYAEGMEPCPLCIFQRVAYLALAVVLLAAAAHHPRGWGTHVYAGLIFLAAGAGVALALRHLYLQGLPPDQVPSCGPGLDYMLDTFPLMEAIGTVLAGSGECAEVEKVWGLTIPAWTLMGYLGIGGLGLLANLAGRRGSRA